MPRCTQTVAFFYLFCKLRHGDGSKKKNPMHQVTHSQVFHKNDQMESETELEIRILAHTDLLSSSQEYPISFRSRTELKWQHGTYWKAGLVCLQLRRKAAGCLLTRVSRRQHAAPGSATSRWGISLWTLTYWGEPQGRRMPFADTGKGVPGPRDRAISKKGKQRKGNERAVFYQKKIGSRTRKGLSSLRWGEDREISGPSENTARGNFPIAPYDDLNVVPKTERAIRVHAHSWSTSLWCVYIYLAHVEVTEARQSKINKMSALIVRYFLC